MALFKVFRGQRNDLDSVAKVDGHAYFCTDDGSFWVDHQEIDEIVRTQINKADWNNDINNAIENLLNSNKIVVNAEITSEKSPFLISKIDENGSRRATLVIGEKGRKDGKDFYKLGLQAEAVALQTYSINEDGSKTSGPGISASSLTNQISILGNAQFESAPWIMAEPTDDYHAVNKAYLDDKIGSAIASVYRYKGVKTYAELLLVTDKTIGDVYEVTDEAVVNGKIYPAGTNFAWNGTEWDPLGGSLAGYVTEDKLNTTLENYVACDGYNELNGSLHFDDSDTSKQVGISAETIETFQQNEHGWIYTAALESEFLTFKSFGDDTDVDITEYYCGGFNIENSDGSANLAVDTGLHISMDNYTTNYTAHLIHSTIDGYYSELIFPSELTDYCFQSDRPMDLSGHIRVYEDITEKGNGGGTYANYGFEDISYHSDGNYYYFSFPEKDGTFALLSDIPTNYVTTDTFQTISKMKIFTGEVEFADTGYGAPYEVNGAMIGSRICVGNGSDKYLSVGANEIYAISTVGEGAFTLNSSGLTFNSIYGVVSLSCSHNNNPEDPKKTLTIRGDELSLLSNKTSYETSDGYLRIRTTKGIDLSTDTNNGSFFSIDTITAKLRLADSNGNWSAVNFSKAGLPTIEINKANGDRTSETIATREWVKQQIEWLIVK